MACLRIVASKCLARIMANVANYNNIAQRPQEVRREEGKFILHITLSVAIMAVVLGLMVSLYHVQTESVYRRNIDSFQYLFNFSSDSKLTSNEDVEFVPSNDMLLSDEHMDCDLLVDIPWEGVDKAIDSICQKINCPEDLKNDLRLGQYTRDRRKGIESVRRNGDKRSLLILRIKMLKGNGEIYMFGYSFGQWTISEKLTRNVKIINIEDVIAYHRSEIKHRINAQCRSIFS